MNLRDGARRLLAAEAVLKRLGQLVGELRAEVTEATLRLYRETGTDRLALEEGTVSVVKPSARIEVTDEPALLGYVARNHPSEIVETIRPSFRNRLVGRLVTADGKVVDSATGEVVSWARPVPAEDPRSVAVRPNDGARDEAARLLRLRMPELEEGEAP